MMQKNYLPAALWKTIQDSVPVACVDILPLQVSADKEVTAVGLIHRDTPHEGKRWCVVGGRMWRNETFPEAIRRQLAETLGPEVRCEVDAGIQPHHVAQYLTYMRKDFEPANLDPRQHAIGLSFAVPIIGPIQAMGEAFSFEWFAPDRIPEPEAFGFNQDRVVRACLAAWRGRC